MLIVQLLNQAINLAPFYLRPSIMPQYILSVLDDCTIRLNIPVQTHLRPNAAVRAYFYPRHDAGLDSYPGVFTDESSQFIMPGNNRLALYVARNSIFIKTKVGSDSPGTKRAVISYYRIPNII